MSWGGGRPRLTPPHSVRICVWFTSIKAIRTFPDDNKQDQALIGQKTEGMMGTYKLPLLGRLSSFWKRHTKTENQSGDHLPASRWKTWPTFRQHCFMSKEQYSWLTNRCHCDITLWHEQLQHHIACLSTGEVFKCVIVLRIYRMIHILLYELQISYLTLLLTRVLQFNISTSAENHIWNSNNNLLKPGDLSLNRSLKTLLNFFTSTRKFMKMWVSFEHLRCNFNKQPHGGGGVSL